MRKSRGNFGDLSCGFIRAEINRRTHRHGAEVVRLFHGAEQYLIEFIRQRQHLVVVDFDDERNLVRVLSGNASQYPECRRYAIAAPFDSEFDDVLRIEVLGIRRKGSPGGMLDALIDWQD